LWHLRFRGGFLLGALLLAAALVAGQRAVAAPARRAPAMAFGLLAGIGFWTNQLLAPALAVFAAALLWRAPAPRRVAILVPFALGSLPFWIYNVVHPAATFRYLAGHLVANAPR